MSQYQDVENRIKENISKEEARIRAIPYGTTEYWKQRCVFREKMDDPTYSESERENCFRFHRILVNKMP